MPDAEVFDGRPGSWSCFPSHREAATAPDRHVDTGDGPYLKNFPLQWPAAVQWLRMNLDIIRQPRAARNFILAVVEALCRSDIRCASEEWACAVCADIFGARRWRHSTCWGSILEPRAGS